VQILVTAVMLSPGGSQLMGTRVSGGRLKCVIGVVVRRIAAKRISDMLK
jgi:hypothetical protein